MQARLSVGGEPSASLALWDWLHAERQLRGRVSLELAPPSPGVMGVVSELVVTSMSAGTAAVLASSIQVWLTQRQADVTLSVTGPDGRQLTIEAHQAVAAETEKLLRNIFGVPEGPLADPAAVRPSTPLGLIRGR